MRNLVWLFFGILFTARCSFTSSQDFVDGAFLPNAGLRYEFTMNPVLLANVPAKITITAKNGSGVILPTHQHATDLSVVGTGTLDVLADTGFQNGRKEVTIRYNKSLSGQNAEFIVLRCTSRVTGESSSSNGISVVAATFKITAPSSITAGANFSVTVAAQGSDGSPYSDYTGTVNLLMEQGIGSFSVASATVSSGGTATVSTSFSGSVGQIKIRARDSQNSAFYGISSEITVGMGTGDSYVLNLAATPVSATSLRLSWNKVAEAVGYNVYRKNGATYALASGSPFTGTLYQDTGLSDQQTYEYKVEALKSVTLEVLNTATASGKPSACTSTVSASITSGVVTWTKAQSPICVTAPIAVTNATLIIQPGATLLFSVNAYLDIGTGGTLQAQGNAQELITMTGASDFSVTANRWGKSGNGEAITFSSTAAIGTIFSVDGNYTYDSGSVIDYVLIEGSGRGIENTSNLSLLVDHTLFRNIELKQNATINGLALHFSNGGSNNYTRTAVIRNSGFNNLRSNFALGVNGNAAYIRYTTSSAYILIKDNLFVSNTSLGTSSIGGALYLYGDTTTTNYCEVSGNYSYKNSVSSNWGGAIAHLYASGTNLIRRNTFYQNSVTGASTYGGGAIYISSNTTVNSVIEDNVFRQNSAATGAVGGGAISIYQSNSLVMRNNLFDSNSAQNGKGGAILFAAGVSGNNLIRRNTFTGNAAANGAGIHIDDGSGNIIVEYNHFASQTATTAGAAFNLPGTISNNNTVRFNSFDYSTLTPTAIYTAEDATYTITGNWWGQTVTNGSTCTANAGLCTKSAGGFDVTFTSNRTTAPPLCKVDSANVDCTGSTY